jgi:hypothetical protein
MRSIRTSALGLVTLALVGGTGVAAIAQSGSSPDAVPDPMAAAYVTGTVTFDGVNLAEPTTTNDDGVVRRRGESWGNLTVRASDARFSGKLTVTWHEDRYPGTGDAGIAWGVTRIENDSGAWSGPMTGLTRPGEDSGVNTAWLVGEGAYEGLSAYMNDHAAGIFDGMIFPGVPPAVR